MNLTTMLEHCLQMMGFQMSNNMYSCTQNIEDQFLPLANIMTMNGDKRTTAKRKAIRGEMWGENHQPLERETKIYPANALL